MTLLVAMLGASACNGGAKECRQLRLQAEVPMGTKVTTSTRATPDRAALEQAQWTVVDAPQPWAEHFPEVTHTIAPPDGVASSDQLQVLTVTVADGCD